VGDPLAPVTLIVRFQALNAGIGRVTLVRIEKGEQSPRYETLIALSRALGLPLADVLPADSGP